MHGVSWIGHGELPDHLFGMQGQWLRRQLGNAPSAGCRREDPYDAVYLLSRDGVCGGRTPLYRVQGNRATLECRAEGSQKVCRDRALVVLAAIVLWLDS